MEMDLKALRENELERIVEPRVELDDANRQGVRVEILKVIVVKPSKSCQNYLVCNSHDQLLVALLDNLLCQWKHRILCHNRDQSTGLSHGNNWSRCILSYR
jgi:hypothetical protein